LNFDGEIGAASARLFAGLVIFPRRERAMGLLFASAFAPRASSQGQLAVSKFPNTLAAQKHHRETKNGLVRAFSQFLGIY